MPPKAYLSVAAAVGVAAMTATAATAADRPQPPPVKTVASEKVVTLAPHAVSELHMPIRGLGDAKNALEPCWGFEIRGSGVDLAAADLLPYGGPVGPEAGQENTPNGGVPGAQRQPDGTFTIPASEATLTTDNYLAGRRCQAAGWDFRGPDGRVKPEFAHARTTRAAASRRARSARANGVTVLFAGMHLMGDKGTEIVVRVRTGDLAGKVTLTGHARVALQN